MGGSRSPVAYGLLLQEADGRGIEYILLDPNLYTLDRSGQSDGAAGWERRTWHPNLVLSGVAEHHPRLLLELLRGATDLRDAGEEAGGTSGLRRIDGVVSHYRALLACYETAPSLLTQARAAAAALAPVSIWLEGAENRVRRLQMTLPPETPDLSGGVLTYEVGDDLPVLAPPAEAVDRQPDESIPAAPRGPAGPLPLSVAGERAVITPPFVTGTGGLRVMLDGAQDGTSYILWRISRGRLLPAAAGATAGPGGRVAVPLPVPPGAYVLEVALPRPGALTVTVEEEPAADVP